MNGRRAALVSFVAEQIDVRPETIDDYLVFKQNRRRHAAELQDRLRLRPFGTRPAAELAGWLLPRAIENDRLSDLAELVMEECRQRRIVVPPPRRLERLCIDLRYQARREIERRLTGGLSAEQRRRLDALTQRPRGGMPVPFRPMAAPSMRRCVFTRASATALIAARDKKEDAFDAITAVIPWDRFRASVAEAEALARSEEFDWHCCINSRSHKNRLTFWLR